MRNVSNAEKAVLMKMYPEGCRVELEYMGPDVVNWNVEI